MNNAVGQLLTFPSPVSGPSPVDPNVVRGNDNTLRSSINNVRRGLFNIYDYGAVGDGIADDTSAWTQMVAAMQSNGGGTMRVPTGVYKATAALSIAQAAGAGTGYRLWADPYTSVLMPSSAVSIGLTLNNATNTDGTTQVCVIDGLVVDMANAAASPTGLLLGSTGTTTGRYHLNEVTVLRAGGATGIGLYAKDLVDLHCVNGYFGQSSTNCYIGGGASFPTTLRFTKSSFREAGISGSGGVGVTIAQAFQCVFDQSLFEANRAEGLYCVPNGGAVAGVVLLSPWFEDNFHGSGAVALNYHLRADGTLAAGVAIRVSGAYCGGSSRAIYYKNVVDSLIDTSKVQNAANQVYIDAGSVGAFTNWPNGNGSSAYGTVVTNTVPTTFVYNP